jgi:hypothetical protein
MHDSSPYRTNLPGRKAERLGSHTIDGVIRSARSQVKATLSPGPRTCAGPCLRFGAPVVRDPYPLRCGRVRRARRPNYRAIRSESLRPSGPDVERRRQRGIADKAVDIRAITTSKLEFSAPIYEEYAELAVRTPHPPYRLDARGEAGSSLVNIRLSKGAMFDHTLNS